MVPGDLLSLAELVMIFMYLANLKQASLGGSMQFLELHSLIEKLPIFRFFSMNESKATE